MNFIPDEEQDVIAILTTYFAIQVSIVRFRQKGPRGSNGWSSLACCIIVKIVLSPRCVFCIAADVFYLVFPMYYPVVENVGKLSQFTELSCLRSEWWAGQAWPCPRRAPSLTRLTLSPSAVWRRNRRSLREAHDTAREETLSWPDIIKSYKRLIADPKVPAKARISREKCHLRQNSVNCDKCHNLHQNSTICIKTALFT